MPGTHSLGRWFGMLSVLCIAPPLGAQDDTRWDYGEAEDYSTYFDQGDEQVEPEGSAEPASLAEARRQKRGYRLGRRKRGTVATGDSGYADPGGTHTVRRGDTLWSISETYLESPWAWPRLWSYNPDIDNPHLIYPHETVRLGGEGSETTQASNGQQPTAQATADPASARQLHTRKVVVAGRGPFQPGSVLVRTEGYLSASALQPVGSIVGAPEEHMILSVGDYAYVELPARAWPENTELTVFRRPRPDERYPTERGDLVKLLGTLAIRQYDKKTRLARVEVVEALDVIERGLRVALAPEPFQVIQPAPSKVALRGRIIAATRPRELLSYGDMVFLDVGSRRGVEAGNRFFVVRRRDPFLQGIAGRESEVGALVDPPPYRPGRFPDEVVGELRVVHVEKDTTMALITRADIDLTYGDVAELRPGH